MVLPAWVMLQRRIRHSSGQYSTCSKGIRSTGGPSGSVHHNIAPPPLQKTDKTAAYARRKYGGAYDAPPAVPFYRQRRAPQQTGQLQLRFQLCGHQIQHQHLQRPPLLSVDSSSPSFSAVLRQATPAERKTEGSPEPSENRYFFDRLLFRECLPGPGHSKADTYTHMRIHSSWLSCTESPSAFSFRLIK